MIETMELDDIDLTVCSMYGMCMYMYKNRSESFVKNTTFHQYTSITEWLKRGWPGKETKEE